MVVLRPVRRAARVALHVRSAPHPGGTLRAPSRIGRCVDPPHHHTASAGMAFSAGDTSPCDPAAQPPPPAPIADLVGFSAAHGGAPGLTAVTDSQLSFISS